MDDIEMGRGYGSVLPEALRAIGATGVFLNHIEKRLSMDKLIHTVKRANEVGLMTMVCADNVSDAKIISKLKPTIIVAEEPEKIEGAKRNINELKQKKLLMRL
jgi:triosephosphate isomerase